MSPYVTSRGKARRRAVDILFEADAKQASVTEIMELRLAQTEQSINPLTRRIVLGVAEHRDEIDELLSTYSRGWTLDRMPNVDRAVLRVGAWEVLYGDPENVPEAVAVKEATDIARELSTDESPSFVNGLLSRLQSLKPSIVGPTP
ncbi:transcription antitermination factor NusB [Arthrobacter sp. UM1]|uniref:transcription antitermination factor NusB n=1 Tax=Arthrobacter sp. UM1 TaxID=2766776 RepID=UPI001CF6643E|nr:transcription antitermination factor NusB [Arthrobacter sp. UM1]MCB4207575.1 transcription antitermination factor NusB [Arthrobacter sp. UM1]